MSQSILGFEKTYISESDYSAKQYYLAKAGSAANSCVLSSAAADRTIGVVQNNPIVGEPATVRFLGTTKVVASAAITKGAQLTSAASGKVVATTTADEKIIGIALEAAAADGDIIEMQFAMYNV